MGSVSDIEEHASARDLTVRHVDLNAQYRSGGSEAYLDWVLRLLGLRGDGPVTWHDEPDFTVDVVDSPAELESRLTSVLNRDYGARMTAGYCWPWSNPRSDGSLVPDVTIGDWSRPWNLKSERSVGGALPTVDDATFDRLVRHVYKALLTRGMIGTLLYSPDRETREMLRGVVNPR